MEWISVKDRLPEKNGRYIVNSSFYKNDPVMTSYFGYRDGSKILPVSFYCKDVTHWQPLPEPPKEDEVE